MRRPDTDLETDAPEGTRAIDDGLAHEAWMDRFFGSFYARRPVDATFIGVHDFDHRLPDYSEREVGDALSDVRELLAEVEDAPTGRRAESRARSSRLTPMQRIDRRLARGVLRILEWELGSTHFDRGNPSLYTGEAVFGVMSLFLSRFAPLGERGEAAVARAEAVPGFLDQARRNVRAAPPEWTERAIRECDGGIAFFTAGVEALAGELRRASEATVAERLEGAARRAAAAFADHRAFLESVLARRTAEHAGCGAQTLDLLLREGHVIESDAGELARYAEDRLDEAEEYLTDHAADHLARTPADALGRLMNLHPTREGYLRRYGDLWDEVRAAVEEKGLLTWPDFPIRYVERPHWARAAAPHLYFLFYRSPPAFARGDVHDYLVAPLPTDAGPAVQGSEGGQGQELEAFLRANNDAVIKLNHVIHHGGLGHHVQNWHAFRSESRIGRVAAVDCAARIAMLCGGTMAEGWACYATDLAAEAGLLTSLEAYSGAHGRVRMAARAIVDVGLHHGEMTLADAARFYESRGWSAAAARAEAVKTSMFPASALMYLIGTDTIHRLRATVARRAGSDFDLCRFHDTLLSYGSIPVSLVAEEMLAETS